MFEAHDNTSKKRALKQNNSFVALQVRLSDIDSQLPLHGFEFV